MKNYYLTLGVSPSATLHEIKTAYRKAALKCHPDRNPGDNASEAMFKEAADAYEVLSDKEKRASYDSSLSGQIGIKSVFETYGFSSPKKESQKPPVREPTQYERVVGDINHRHYIAASETIAAMMRGGDPKAQELLSMMVAVQRAQAAKEPFSAPVCARDLRKLGEAAQIDVSSHVKDLFEDAINGETRRAREWIAHDVTRALRNVRNIRELGNYGDIDTAQLTGELYKTAIEILTRWKLKSTAETSGWLWSYHSPINMVDIRTEDIKALGIESSTDVTGELKEIYAAAADAETNYYIRREDTSDFRIMRIQEFGDTHGIDVSQQIKRVRDARDKLK